LPITSDGNLLLDSKPGMRSSSSVLTVIWVFSNPAGPLLGTWPNLTRINSGKVGRFKKNQK